MRIDNATFAAANKDATKEPVIVVEVAFDSANTDLYYFCTHTVDGLSGVNVINNCIEGVSGTSQKLNPDKALSTIGSMSFETLDSGLTELQKSKLNSGYGLKGKRVRFYIGDASLAWSDFILAQTQIIETVDYKDGSYKFKCSDVQRQMRKDIFELKTTALSASVTANSATINVYKTSEFKLVQQPVSPSGITDAHGQKVGYITLSNGCIVRYTGKTSASFTGCTWGVFDTKHLIEDIEKPSDAGADNAPSVTEFVYLEMPAVMMAYAILTGSIYGSPGEFLPDHWHLGISTQYVRTADFTGIGLDWWDTSNADNGVPAVVKGLKKTDGKKFLEEQIYMMLGAFSPVYANGELGLKRMTVIPSQGGYVRELNVNNIASYGSLTHDMKSVINFAVLDWNYVIGKEDYTRKNIMPDSLSIARHGQSDTKELKFRTLETSRHSYATIKSRFDSLRDRYAGPPLRLKLTLLSSQNDLEIGDIVRVNLEHVKDYTGDKIDGTLDRNFEVQQVSTDWVSGNVSVDLFGSSQNASTLAPDEPGAAIDTTWYSSEGTEISAANFPGKVSSAGGVTSITGSISLTGNAFMNVSSAVYYCDEDLTINSGVTVTISHNVQLRVKGFFQHNGIIYGKGLGLSGGVGTANLSDPLNAGKAGALGTTISQDGVSDVETYRHNITKHNVSTSISSWVKSLGNRPAAVVGTVNTSPILDFVTTSSELIGIPDDFRGSSGSAGGSLLQRIPGYGPMTDGDGVGSYSKPSEPDLWVAGGNGGAGGAGLLIVCRGMDMGASAKIDLSGIDGSVTTSVPALYSGRDVYSGCGAGGYCGGCYILLDGVSATAPTLNSTNAIAEVGSCPVPAGGYNVISDQGAQGNDYGPLYSDFGSANVGAQPSRVNTYESNFRIQYLTGFIESNPESTGFADPILSISLSESTNTPPTAAGNLSTIEATVTPPADTNYSYAKVYYRVSGATAWMYAGPASTEVAITVASDGKTYEVGAQSVSKQGNESSGGVSDFITVTDVINLPDDTVIGTVIPLMGISAITLKDYLGAVFAGRDAKFEWDNANAELEHFLHYKIQIFDTGTNLLRTETVTDPFFVYTYEKNAEDYNNQNSETGANRQFTIKVTPVGKKRNNLGDLYEGATQSLTVSNTAPALPTNITVSPGFKIVKIDFDIPDDIDYSFIKVWGDTYTGFPYVGTDPLAVAAGGPITISGLDDDTTYYYRMAAFDAFGQGTVSGEYSVTTQALADSSLGPWASVDDVDRAFIEDHMDDDSIESDKIVKLTAAKIVTGTLAATTAISCEGTIEAETGTYNVTMGPKDVGGGDIALFSFMNGGSKIVSFNEDGTAQFTGEVNVTSGSINGTSSASVASGANKANYGFNASGHLITVIDGNQLPITPAGSGLNITGHRMGYFDGTEWKSYMDKDGKFYLDGAGTNKLWWDGASLVVRGDIQATSIASGSIDGETITGSTLRTAASGQRVEITSASNRMRFYDPAGAVRMTLDDATSSTGYIEVSGTTSKFGMSSRYCKYGFYAVGGTYGFVSNGATNGFDAVTSSGTGVKGDSSTGTGVRGISLSSYGGHFSSSSYIGAYGTGLHGFYGVGNNSTGYGVYGSGKYGAYLHGTTYDAYLANTGAGSFTGSHDGLLLKTAGSIDIGDIVTVDSIIAKNGVSSTVPAVSQSSVALSKAAYGVASSVQDLPDIMTHTDPSTLIETKSIQISALKGKTEAEYNALKSTYDYVVINAVGEGQINVCDEGGDLDVGDFICTSTVAGKGKLYTGNDMRFVVAKILEPVDWSAEIDTEKTVACVYMCG